MRYLFSFYCLVVCLLCGCSTPVPNHNIGIFIESPSQGPASGINDNVIMPHSGYKLSVVTLPVAGIESLTNVVVASRQDPVLDSVDYGILVKLNQDAWMKLHQSTAAAMGKRLVLIADGIPLGYSVVTSQLRRGEIYFYIETEGVGEARLKQIENVAFLLNEFILEFRTYKEANS